DLPPPRKGPATSDEEALLAVPTAARVRQPELRTAGERAADLAEAILDRSAPWIAAKSPNVGTGPEPRQGIQLRQTETRPRLRSCLTRVSIHAKASSRRYLEMVNAHPRDDWLVFDSASHTYFLEGRALSGSVTYLASSLSEDFDGRAAIQAMRNGRSQAWPRVRYTLGAKPVDLCSLRPGPFGLLLGERASQRTRAAMPSEQVAALFLQCGADIARWQLALQEELLNRACMTFGPGPPMTIGPDQQLWTYERELSEEEILQQWQLCGRDAADRGTEAHYQIELWLNRDGCRLEEIEVQHSLQFMALLAQSGAKAFRTEWRIFGEEEDLAGSIDFAARLPHGGLVLVDWKRSDKLEKGLRNAFRRMAAPFEHLHDCKGAVYSLQLNLYRWILEKYYGEKISSMILVSVHPDAPFATAVPDLHLE
ncbi:unnamed protein product, partial [Symbiodinium sp. CCMP2456]